MNVLYFVNRFPKLSESFVINEIHELEKRGHSVAVFSLKEPGIDMTHDEVMDLEAEVGYLPDPGVRSVLGASGRWCLDSDVVQSMAHSSDPVKHAGAVYIAGHCINFVESLDFGIDHVHGHFLNWPKLGAQYTAERLNVTCTATAHAYGLYSDPNIKMLRRLADRLDRVVTISEYNKCYLEEEVGTNSPIDVVHMGINPEKFQPTDDKIDNRVLTVARFVEKKGITYGIEAIADIVKKVPDLEYHLVGSGPKEDEIRSAIEKYSLGDNVKILGNVTDEQLIQEYSKAKVFLLPCVVAQDGDRDGIPVVLMEAMAMECIPISTYVSGIPELIEDRKSGLLVEPADVDALRETIQRCFHSESTLNVEPKSARERVLAKYDVQDCALAMIDVFARARTVPPLGK